MGVKRLLFWLSYLGKSMVSFHVSVRNFGLNV